MKTDVKINYYDEFRCTADQCPYTCCQEWFITIDEETRNKWKGVELEGKKLSDYVQKEDNHEYSMKLNKDKKCSFLTDNQLCGMVVNLGESYLSKICMSYPRHISSYSNKIEYALDFGCPAVIDLLNQYKENLTIVGEIQEDNLLHQVRALVIDLLKSKEDSLHHRLMYTYYCLLDLLEQDPLLKEHIESYKQKEYYEPLMSQIKQIGTDAIESFWERNEFFIDMVQLYQEEDIYTEYLGDIALLSKELDTQYSDEVLERKINLFEIEYQQYLPLMQSYLIAELWANILKEDIELEDMVRVFSWVVLEYCTMRHAIFLRWIHDGQPTLSYELVRSYMMIVSRMSSDDYKEIKTYIDLSFDTCVLEWGHLALVLNVMG